MPSSLADSEEEEGNKGFFTAGGGGKGTMEVPGIVFDFGGWLSSILDLAPAQSHKARAWCYSVGTH